MKIGKRNAKGSSLENSGKIFPQCLEDEASEREGRSYLRYSLWMRLRINVGTVGPGIEILEGGDLLFCIFFLKATVTLTMKRAILLSRTTMTAICAKTAAFFLAPESWAWQGYRNHPWQWNGFSQRRGEAP